MLSIGMPRIWTSHILMPRSMSLLLLWALAPTNTRPAHSQPGTRLSDLTSGKTHPLALQLKDLTDAWQRMAINLQSSGGASSLNLMLGAPSGASEDVYYTKGETVTTAGQTYLVAYRAQVKRASFMDFMLAGQRGQPPALPEKLTPQTTLALSLLNLRMIGALQDIRPFDLDQEVAAANAAHAALLPAVGQARLTALDQQSSNQLKQLILGIKQYEQDHDNTLPPMENPAVVKQAILPYVKNEGIFVHPGTKEPYLPNATLSGRREDEALNPRGDVMNVAEMVAFYEASPSADGTRGVAFLDGHVKRITEAEWPALKQASKIP